MPRRKWETCWIVYLAGYKIELRQKGPEHFQVQYGKQVSTWLTYEAACHDLGATIMHALTLEGNVDNSLVGEHRP